MIDRDRLVELLNQNGSIAQEHQTVESQYRSYGVEPEALIDLLDTILEDAGMSSEQKLAMAFQIGVLVGREAPA